VSGLETLNIVKKWFIKISIIQRFLLVVFVGVTAFLYYVLLFSLHTRHGMTIWVHLVWKNLSICWITTWNL